MSPLRAAYLVLANRGVSPTWLLWLLVGWAAAIVASRVAIPHVGPDVMVSARALEQLGAIAVCIPVVLLALLLTDSTPWMTNTSPRGNRVLRLTSFLLINSVGLSSAAIAATLYPADVRWIRVVSLFWLAMSLTVLAGSLVDRVWAAVAGPLLVALATVRGLVPWEWNLVYNPETDAALVMTAVVAQLAATCAANFPLDVRRNRE